MNTSIAVYLETENRFSTLSALMKLAGLYSTLDCANPLTLFAVDNDCFQNMTTAAYARLINEPRDKITRMMQYQVVHGAYPKNSLAHGEKIQTLNGNDIRIYKKNNLMKINESHIIEFDTTLSNGVIHTVDAML